MWEDGDTYRTYVQIHMGTFDFLTVFQASPKAALSQACYDSTIHRFSIYKHMGTWKFCKSRKSKPPELPTKNEASANVGTGLSSCSTHWNTLISGFICVFLLVLEASKGLFK